MKFTLSWLKDHLETDASLAEIVETLTMTGLEVERVDDRAVFKPFVIAKVLTAERHPQADKLQVLTVDAGDGKRVQVVCGAPNARAGLIGAFARPGDYVPGIDQTLGIGMIRGVESFGMMCSERELELSDAHDGIIDLPQTAIVGTSFAAFAGLDDPVIEINLTPNRPDAMGVRGIARDLVAAGLGKMKPMPMVAPRGSFACPVAVRIESPELCPAFGLRLIRNVRNGASPNWMQQRLKAIGLRPISALVDMTNYVTFDLGRPLHVFDADKVTGALVVRRAREGELFLALDGKSYKPDPSMCVIADENGVESLAGVIGGKHSGCDANTVNVLIESALWQPLNIARTGRELGISTDARYRFERGVDPAAMLPGLDHATALVLEICGGDASEPVVAGQVPTPILEIDFPLDEVKRLTGLELPHAESIAILRRLGFGVEGKGATVKTLVPSWRPDVHGKADLVEEVMRIHGVNKIVPQPLGGRDGVNTRTLTLGQTRTRNARRALAARGMLEAVTYSFISRQQAQLFGGGAPELSLANPIAADMSDMRPSLLPSLAAAVQRNAARGLGDVALFEVSHIYRGEKPEDQKRVAAGIRRGTAKAEGGGRHWSGAAENVDVHDAKADALAALAALGVDSAKVQISDGGANWFHPGRRGQIQLGPKLVLATFGEFHPLTLEALDVSGPMAGFEVWLDAVPEQKKRAVRTKPKLELPAYQAVKRDFAFVIDRTMQAASLIRAAHGADKRLVADVLVFDQFESAALGEGKKSLAIEVTLQPADRTLTDEEIDAVSKRIVEAVGKATGGVLRS